MHERTIPSGVLPFPFNSSSFSLYLTHAADLIDDTKQAGNDTHESTCCRAHLMFPKLSDFP